MRRQPSSSLPHTSPTSTQHSVLVHPAGEWCCRGWSAAPASEARARPRWQSSPAPRSAPDSRPPRGRRNDSWPTRSTPATGCPPRETGPGTSGAHRARSTGRFQDTTPVARSRPRGRRRPRAHRDGCIDSDGRVRSWSWTNWWVTGPSPSHRTTPPSPSTRSSAGRASSLAGRHVPVRQPASRHVRRRPHRGVRARAGER